MKKIIKRQNAISIPSSLDYLKDVDLFVEKKLKKIGLDQSQLADVAISVTEAVTNAVVHGNKENIKKTVWVNLEIKPDEVIITVKDQGRGFNPSSLPSPIEKENILKKVGRGIFILKSLMDKVDFIFEPQGGTSVRMTKYFSFRRLPSGSKYQAS